MAGTTADAVFLLGDIFEVWVGDDARTRPFEARCTAAIAATAARVPVWLQHGNRDFLIGAEFAAATGARLLADPAVGHGVRPHAAADARRRAVRGRRALPDLPPAGARPGVPAAVPVAAAGGPPRARRQDARGQHGAPRRARHLRRRRRDDGQGLARPPGHRHDDPRPHPPPRHAGARRLDAPRAQRLGPGHAACPRPGARRCCAGRPRASSGSRPKLA